MGKKTQQATDSDKKSTEQAAPGLALDRFGHAVSALAQLRDNGAFLVFLGRRSRVRMVGEVDVFRKELDKLIEEDVSEEDANAALDEMSRLLGAYVLARDVEESVDMLSAIEPKYRFLVEREGASARKTVLAKMKLLSDTFFTDALKRRGDRMRLSVGTSLEEVDADVVGERSDELTHRRIEDPFLRLRLRYSTPASDHLNVFFPFLPNEGAESFEIDCDDSDIDLLIRRLVQAKQKLVQARDKQR